MILRQLGKRIAVDLYDSFPADAHFLGDAEALARETRELHSRYRDMPGPRDVGDAEQPNQAEADMQRAQSIADELRAYARVWEFLAELLEEGEQALTDRLRVSEAA